jgi:plastocyanin
LPVSAVLSEAGSQHSVTFPAAGTFDYSCQVHGPQMAGRVVVR